MSSILGVLITYIGNCQLSDEKYSATFIKYNFFTGFYSNPSDKNLIVSEKIIRIDSADWLQLFFGKTFLGKNVILKFFLLKILVLIRFLIVKP